MADQYYILDGETQKGPYTRTKLLDILRDDMVYSQAPCAAAGDPEWSTVAAVVGWDTDKAKANEAWLRKMDEAESRMSMLIFLILLLIVLAGWIWTQSLAGTRAGWAAAAYINQQIPGGEAKCRILSVDNEGSKYHVALFVDARNAFGGWVRQPAEVWLTKGIFTFHPTKHQFPLPTE